MSFTTLRLVSMRRLSTFARPARRVIVNIPTCTTFSNGLLPLSFTATKVSSSVRSYSTPSDDKKFSPESFVSSEDPNSPISQIMNNPAVLETLIDLNEYLLEKKFISNDGKPPGMLAFVKMMSDSTFKEKLLKVKTTMDEQGIKLTEADLMKFAQTMGLDFRK